MTPWRSEALAPAPAWLCYGLAVVSVGLALVLSLLLNSLSVNSPFLLFFAAIAFSAWYGGLRPGLLASGLSVLASLYFFLPPAGSLAVGDLTTLVPMVIFILVATLINLLSEARNRAESAARAQSARLQVTLASIGDAVMATDAEGRVTFMNQVAENLTGWPQAEALGKDLATVFRIINEDTRTPVENPTVRVLREGQITGLANHTLLVARDGAEHPIDDSGAPIGNKGQPVAGAVLIFRDITARRRALAEREALLAREQAARAEAEAAQERFAFLAEASEVLASSLDYETTLAAVARMAVPRVADWCAVDVVMEDGTVEQLAVTHVDPAKVAWAHKLRERYPPDPAALSGVYNVIRTGKPEILPEITEAMLVAAARDEEQLAMIRQIGFTSAITMPLQARDRTLGALTFVAAESGHRYSEDDIALAEDLARRAALAIDNARLYREAQAERQRFYTTLASIGDAVIATDTEGRITFLNTIAERLTGWSLAAAAGRALAEVFHIVNEQTRHTVESPVDRVIREGVVVGLANHTVLIARDGGERAIDDSGAPIRDEAGKLIGVVLVFRDIRERREAEAREQFLAEVTIALTASLDYEDTLAQIARQIVPAVADWFRIDLVTPTGELQTVAIAHKDPDKEHWMWELQKRFPPNPRAAQGVYQVLRTGQTEFYPDIPAAVLVASIQDPEELALVRTLGFRSAIIVPLSVRKQILGVLTFVAAESDRHFTQVDRALAEALARRAAVAIDNARLYREAQAERQRFYTTLASIGDAVIATDTTGRVTFMNAVAQKLTGWTLDAARDQPLTTVFHIVNEQTRHTVESPVDRVIREGMVVGLANHTVLIARDGEERAIDDSGAPIWDESGKLIGVVLVFRDIHERRQAETRERFLTDVTAALATSLDYETTLSTIARLMTPALADNCIIDIVEAGGLLRRVAVAAADPAEEAMLHELQRRLPPDSGGSNARQAIETRRPVLVSEITDSFWDHLDFDPEHIPLLRAFQPRSLLVVPFVVSERVLGSIMLNMTQSRRQYTDADLPLIEEVARRAALAIDNARLYREAQAAIATRDQFLSIASHELKTPLTSLMAAAQLLQRRTERDGVLNPRDRRTMQLVVEQAARLNRMVLSLLDLSRIETGQLSIERMPLDLGDLVRRLVEEAQPALERHQIHLDLPAQPLMIEGDALRLEQVVQNLLNNAVKYSIEDTTITVRVARQDGSACLAVTDQGIGIPESARARLFQRFYRAPNVDAQQISGMGIGLYVVKEIVTLHEGQIDVASTEGQGSTFTICLPLTPA